LLDKSLNQLLKGSETLISVKIAEYDDLIYEVQKEILSALIRVWSDEFFRIEKQSLEKLKKKVLILSFYPLHR